MNTDEAHSPESVEQLAESVFTDLYQTIILHEAGSIAGDVESIHDMRVSVRRLRVALSNFSICVPKTERKRLKLCLEKLADALGGVRDTDVMISAMKASLANRSHQEKAAISDLIGKLRARRRLRLRALINYLAGEDYADFKLKRPADWFKSRNAESNKNTSEIQFGATKLAKITEAPGAPEHIKEEHGQAA